MSRLTTLWWTALFSLLICGCEGVSHESIDRWRQTEKGPGKLDKALRSSDNAADLRAHAGQNLIQIDSFEKVKSALDAMDDRERHEVLAELAPRLWEDARIEGEMTVPS